MKSKITNFAFFLAILLICLSQGCKKPGWVSQTSGTTNYLLGIWFTDANTGTIVGSRGTILHTTNGGDTWNSQKSGMGPMYWGVRFSDSMNGWVVADDGTILHTTNGGNNWIQQTSGTSEGL